MSAREVIEHAINEHGGVSTPAEIDAQAIEDALFEAGYSIVKLDPLATALDPYIEDNDHIDHDSGSAGDECNRCVAEEAYKALGIKFGEGE